MESPTDCPKGMTVARIPDAATTAGDLPRKPAAGQRTAHSSDVSGSYPRGGCLHCMAVCSSEGMCERSVSWTLSFFLPAHEGRMHVRTTMSGAPYQYSGTSMDRHR